MKSDILKSEYHTVEEYNNYIYGSADVVGLMCLRVFVNNDEERFNQLKQPAMYLGSAFQKVNFLRDIKNDMEHLGRSYFPNLNENSLTNEVKIEIIKDIENDFNEAYKGIVQLPKKGKLGVYLAYMYYLSLLKKLKVADSAKIMEQRIRVSVFLKCVILVKSYFRYKLSMV
jgi:phytoene/squalene synthetase